jgi:hypothetical protein
LKNPEISTLKVRASQERIHETQSNDPAVEIVEEIRALQACYQGTRNPRLPDPLAFRRGTSQAKSERVRSDVDSDYLFGNAKTKPGDWHYVN